MQPTDERDAGIRRSSVSNVNIVGAEVLSSPLEIQQTLPATPEDQEAIFRFRTDLCNMLDRKDPRLFVVVGPCSIHDVGSALEYATRLKSLSDEIGDAIVPVMRVYFEKPRTSLGWKGFLNDPFLDDSFNIEQGLRLARRFLLDLVRIGIPAATEALDPIVPQYLSDLVSWTAIGARTVESQTHREMASGLSSPVGIKNGTDGSVELAVNAIKATLSSHHFLGITQDGRSAVFHTTGNRYAHIVLRGGGRPNYDRESIRECEHALAAAGLAVNIVVDCSHANSGKDPERQPIVLDDCIHQIEQGNDSIVGFMLESHLVGGSQETVGDPSRLRPDMSITDACLGWDATAAALREAAARVRHVLPSRTKA